MSPEHSPLGARPGRSGGTGPGGWGRDSPSQIAGRGPAAVTGPPPHPASRGTRGPVVPQSPLVLPGPANPFPVLKGSGEPGRQEFLSEGACGLHRPLSSARGSSFH